MKSNNEYRICNKCVLDNTAEEITFDEEGVCNFCHFFESLIKPQWHPNEFGWELLQAKLEEIKKYGKKRKYNCIIGISGGIDSSYLTYLAVKEFKLRPLVFHVDAGWNSELAVKNIENIITKLEIDLFTYVVDWEEIKDLQRAYFKSGIANLDVPQDHVFFAMLYHYAIKHKIKYVLTGSNFATESILPKSWGYDAMDSIQIKDIHRRFGNVTLKSYPTINFFKYFIYYPFVNRMEIIKPLNFMPYSKENAIKLLSDEIGWRYYGCKHGESRFTKFFQTYFLPIRFGYDKRKAHLSSMILSGQIKREQALKELEKPPFQNIDIDEEKLFIAKKLDISLEEFDGYINLPKKTFKD